MVGCERKKRGSVLVLFDFLLDVADFLGELLEGVFVSLVLDLELWRIC